MFFLRFALNNSYAIRPRAVVHLFFLLMVIATMAGTASAADIPSEAAAKRHVEEQIARNSRGVVKLIDFQKTDGLPIVKNGMQMYQLEWKANLAISHDSWLNLQTMHVVIPQQPKGNSMPNINETGFTLKSNGYRHVKKGTLTLSSDTQFRKSEKGWRPID